VVQEYGELGPVVLQYENFLRSERRRLKEAAREEIGATDIAVEKKDIIEVRDFRMFNEAGDETNAFQHGEDIWFDFKYHVKRPIDRLTFCYTVRNAEKLEVFMADKRNPANTIASTVGEHRLRVRLKSPNLLAGEYLLSGEIWNNDAGFYVGYSNKRPFFIEQEEYVGTGITHVDYEFSND
jgi:hypothetical protein